MNLPHWPTVCQPGDRGPDLGRHSLPAGLFYLEQREHHGFRTFCPLAAEELRPTLASLVSSVSVCLCLPSLASVRRYLTMKFSGRFELTPSLLIVNNRCHQLSMLNSGLSVKFCHVVPSRSSLLAFVYLN